METTPANASDVATAHMLLHGGETQVWGDTGYRGVDKREENRTTAVDWQGAMKPGKRIALLLGFTDLLIAGRYATA